MKKKTKKQIKRKRYYYGPNHMTKKYRDLPIWIKYYLGTNWM